MACRGFFEWILKLLNFVLMVVGLAMVGYGVYMMVQWMELSGGGDVGPVSPAPYNPPELVQLGRRMGVVVGLSSRFLDQLSKAWFIYSFIFVGVILLIISIFGCIGASTRSGCCLSFYLFLIILLILVELAVGAFMFFDHSWKEVIPADKTGYFEMIFTFLKNNWKMAKWVAFGGVVFEALLFIVALLVQTSNQSEYDSDDEYIGQKSGIRQPLVNRQGVPAPGVPTLDFRPIRNDAWSQRMRGKYGMDALPFQSSDSSRFQQATIASSERKNRCAIL